MKLTSFRIRSVNVAKPEVFHHQQSDIATGIFKQPVHGPLLLSDVNLEGDGQADLINHGGADKALCVYSYMHYPYWEKKLQRKLAYGAFGENLTVDDLSEEELCIGDVFTWGEAVIQISQPRQPCYKLAKKHDIPDLAVQVQDTGYTGFYFRVLRTGIVSDAEPLQLQQTDIHRITLSLAHTVMHHDKRAVDKIERILRVDALSQSWRNTLEKRLQSM